MAVVFFEQRTAVCIWGMGLYGKFKSPVRSQSSSWGWGWVGTQLKFVRGVCTLFLTKNSHLLYPVYDMNLKTNKLSSTLISFLSDASQACRKCQGKIFNWRAPMNLVYDAIEPKTHTLSYPVYESRSKTHTLLPPGSSYTCKTSHQIDRRST